MEKGNEGVAGLIKQTPGTIGYTELIYAENNKLPYASLKNRAGEFVMPDMKSVTAACGGFAQNDPGGFPDLDHGRGRQNGISGRGLHVPARLEKSAGPG